MADEVKKIVALQPDQRTVVLDSVIYPLSEKINPSWFKVGDTVEVKIRHDNVVVYMKRINPSAGQQQGFQPASSLASTPYQKPADKGYSKPSVGPREVSSIWCNSVNAALEVTKAYLETLTPSEVKETDLVAKVIADADQVFSAAMERVKRYE